jgi:carbon monoxide dehydrogenase subunit G
MKFSAREDIEAPVAAVYAVLSDFDMFERMALRRGAEVVRDATATAPAWRVSFTFRGKRRVLSIWQQAAEPPRRLEFAGRGRLIEGVLRIDLIELGPRRTRLTMDTDVQPLTLAARLFFQSMKLARRRVSQRYQSRVSDLARLIETRARSTGS